MSPWARALLSSAISAEKRSIDLSGAGVKVVNVALILQGIREGAAKRRRALALAKSLGNRRLRVVVGAMGDVSLLWMVSLGLSTPHPGVCASYEVSA